MAYTQAKYGEGQHYRKTPQSFKEGRSEDSVKKDHTKNQYSNTSVHRYPDGSYSTHCIAENEELYEIMHASGTGIKVTKDGSGEITVTGNLRRYVKGSQTDTIHGNNDSKTEGHGRQSTKGGQHTEIQGDSTTFVGGATASEHTGGVTSHSKGKHTMSAEKGIGMGVGQNTNQTSQFRMFEDGSINLQVMPAGGDGGAAVIKIDPSGNITITSEGDCSLKCQKFNIEADIELKGNLTQKGSIASSGVHEASAHV